MVPPPVAGDTHRPTRRLTRRGFLTAAGAAAVGVGVARLGAGEPAPDPDIALNDAAGPPAGVRLGVRRVIWSVETEAPVVALTFDDGPDPDLTPRILDALARFDLSATFFVMGDCAARHPDLLREVVARGHELGTHTYGHADLVGLTREQTEQEIGDGRRCVQRLAGVEPRYFRPPRGRLSGAAARTAAEYGDDVVLWSLGRGVAGPGTPDAVRDHVLGDMRAGDIVLLHDGVGREVYRTDHDGPGPVRRRREVEVRALPEILEGALERGFRLTNVSGLLQAATT